SSSSALQNRVGPLVRRRSWPGLVAHPQVRLSRPGGHLLAQDEAVLRVGQHGDRKVAFGGDLEGRLLPDRRTTVKGEPNAVNLAQDPYVPEPATARRPGRRPSHAAYGLFRQQTCAVRSPPVGEVQTRVADLVGGSGEEISRRAVRAGQRPGPGHGDAS